MKQKQPTYQPKAYMQMLKREGRFRILKSKLSKDIRIWHNCERWGDKDLTKNGTIFEVRYWYEDEDKVHTWKCQSCREEPPEGLLGAYIMLDWKRATDEVADATASGHPCAWYDLPF